ncbi:unannotated protein [freshwater metagenome]|uniref:Unannotated protein n=1 Tax=freshwater metagenome TaxID=449393 RepID=A0A6J7PX82_9ZZZZ
MDAAAAEALLGEHEPVARPADEMVGRQAAVAEHDLGVVARRAELHVGVRHRGDVASDVHARCPRGHDEDRRVAMRTVFGVGLGEDEDDVCHRAVRHEPLVSIEHPLVAVEGGGGRDARGVGTREEGFGQREGTRDLAPHVRPEPAVLLGIVRPVGEQLHVAAVGCLHAEDGHRKHRPTDLFRHQCQLHLPEAWPTEVLVEERAPQTLRLDLVLQVALDRAPLALRQLLHHWLEGDELFVDEGAHPVELLLELRFGVEVPCHGGVSLSTGGRVLGEQ